MRIAARTIRALSVAAISAALVAFAPRVAAREAAYGAERSSPAFAKFVDRYLDNFARLHPSIAAGNGIHDHDDRIENFSAAAVTREIALLKSEKRELASFDDVSLTPDERVDKRILDGIIDGWLLDLAIVKSWQRNPMIYASAISDGLHNLMVMEHAPPAARLKLAVSKMHGVPSVIAAARANVTAPPKLFAERGIAFLRGVDELLEKDIWLAFADVHDSALVARAHKEATAARAAIARYLTVLETQARSGSADGWVVGPQAVAARYKAEELIDISLDEMLAIGEREMKLEQARFLTFAAMIDPKATPQDVWRIVRRNHPARRAAVGAVQKMVNELTTFVEAKGLATVPPGNRIVVKPSLPFDLGFASMHASPPLEKKPLTSFFYVTDAQPSMTDVQADAWLERFSYASIGSLAAHEAMPGHWLHSIYMRNTPGKIRRIWIGLNPFPQPSSGQDGWAHYSELLVQESGFRAGDPSFGMAQSSDALTRICRMISGIRLHTREWTIDQSAKFFEDQAYLAAPAALREAERGAYDPTYGGYFLGKRAILKLRRDVERSEGASFSLKRFHERFMSNGIAPIWAQRQLLLPGDTARVIE